MTKPTTIRIPEDLLNEIDQFARELDLDRSTYLREILRKGFNIYRQERYLMKYARGELSLTEVCKALGWDPWEFTAHLKEKNLHLNVSLENWLETAELPT